MWLIPRCGKNLRIYLAFPIQGETQENPPYGAIAKYLRSKGELVSNHRDGYEAYIDEKVSASARSIYEDDIRRLLSADIVVAETSTPSLGVGYEIAKAEDRKKPIICLHFSGNDSSSAMIAGNANLILVSYDTVADLKDKLDALFDSRFKPPS